MKPARRIHWFILCLIILDLAYSAHQYYDQPLDGDMAWNALPAPDVAPTLDDPLGWSTWTEGETYANPNRFFCQWGYREFLLHAPSVLQRAVGPVTSVYLAATLLKVGVHLFLLLLISRSVTGHWRFWTAKGVVALAVAAPFFQANGYRHQMGIIDPSTTYTFFYALPTALLVLYLQPVLDWFRGRSEGGPGVMVTIALILMAPAICLSGPLNPGIILVLTPVGMLSGGYRLPPRLRWIWVWMAVWAVYSLFVGSYNSLTIDNALPLWERYLRLPEGVFSLLTTKLGPMLLIAMLLLNYTLLARRDGGVRWRRSYLFFILFVLCYTLLLPLGGYRDYRPGVVRYDTWLPVTLGAIILYTAGVSHLLRFRYARHWYTGIVVVVALVFTIADQPTVTSDCERQILHRVARTLRPAALRSDTCRVMDWHPNSDEYTIEGNVSLLRHWNILPPP